MIGQRPPSAATLLVTLLSASHALAISVPHGSTQPLSPAALPPGALVATHTQTADVRYLVGGSNFLLFQATLTSSALLTDAGTYTFLYQLRAQPTDYPFLVAAQPLQQWSIAGFNGFAVDAAFLPNGVAPPSTVTRSVDGNTLTFLGFPFSDRLHESPSVTLVLATSATNYADAASAVAIHFEHDVGESSEPPLHGQTAFTTLGPASGIPEPSALALTLLGSAALLLRTRRLPH